MLQILKFMNVIIQFPFWGFSLQMEGIRQFKEPLPSHAIGFKPVFENKTVCVKCNRVEFLQLYVYIFQNPGILMDLKSVCYNILVTKFTAITYWRKVKKPFGVIFLSWGWKRGILKKISLDLNSAHCKWLVTQCSAISFKNIWYSIPGG